MVLEETLRAWVELLGHDPDDREACESLPWLFVLRCCETAPRAAWKDAAVGSLALACAEKNLRDAPKNPIWMRDLGAVKYHLGRAGEAEPLLAEAWRLNSRMVSAAYHLAMAHQEQGQAEKARSVFQAAVNVVEARPLPPSPGGETLAHIRAFAQQVLEVPATSSAR